MTQIHINVKRWNELKAMTDEQLQARWEELGFKGVPSRFRILGEEERRADPEWAARIDSAFGFGERSKQWMSR